MNLPEIIDQHEQASQEEFLKILQEIPLFNIDEIESKKYVKLKILLQDLKSLFPRIDPNTDFGKKITQQNEQLTQKINILNEKIRQNSNDYFWHVEEEKNLLIIEEHEGYFILNYKNKQYKIDNLLNDLEVKIKNPNKGIFSISIQNDPSCIGYFQFNKDGIINSSKNNNEFNKRYYIKKTSTFDIKMNKAIDTLFLNSIVISSDKVIDDFDYQEFKKIPLAKELLKQIKSKYIRINSQNNYLTSLNNFDDFINFSFSKRYPEAKINNLKDIIHKDIKSNRCLEKIKQFFTYAILNAKDNNFKIILINSLSSFFQLINKNEKNQHIDIFYFLYQKLTSPDLRKKIINSAKKNYFESNIFINFLFDALKKTKNLALITEIKENILLIIGIDTTVNPSKDAFNLVIEELKNPGSNFQNAISALGNLYDWPNFINQEQIIKYFDDIFNNRIYVKNIDNNKDFNFASTDCDEDKMLALESAYKMMKNIYDINDLKNKNKTNLNFYTQKKVGNKESPFTNMNEFYLWIKLFKLRIEKEQVYNWIDDFCLFIKDHKEYAENILSDFILLEKFFLRSEKGQKALQPLLQIVLEKSKQDLFYAQQIWQEGQKNSRLARYILSNNTEFADQLFQKSVLSPSINMQKGIELLRKCHINSLSYQYLLNQYYSKGKIMHLHAQEAFKKIKNLKVELIDKMHQAYLIWSFTPQRSDTRKIVETMFDDPQYGLIEAVNKFKFTDISSRLSFSASANFCLPVGTKVHEIYEKRFAFNKKKLIKEKLRIEKQFIENIKLKKTNNGFSIKPKSNFTKNLINPVVLEIKIQKTKYKQEGLDLYKLKIGQYDLMQGNIKKLLIFADNFYQTLNLSTNWMQNPSLHPFFSVKPNDISYQENLLFKDNPKKEILSNTDITVMNDSSSSEYRQSSDWIEYILNKVYSEATGKAESILF